MASLLAGLAALSCLVGTLAHDWDFGRCPRVAPMPGMDLDRFLGDWYVIEQFDTDSSCVKFTYSRVSGSRLRVTKTRQLPPLGPLRHNSYGGTLDVPNGDNEGKMRAQWPLNVAGKGDYIIFDTDYTTYAGLYDCQRLTGLMHRKSAAILSRTPTLAPSIVQRLKGELQSSGVPTRHFDKVSHADCAHPAADDPVIGVDPDTLPDLVADAGDAVEGAVNWVFNGVRNLTDAVTGESEPSLPISTSSPEFGVSEFTTRLSVARENPASETVPSSSVKPAEATTTSAPIERITTAKPIQFSTEETTQSSTRAITDRATDAGTKSTTDASISFRSGIYESVPIMEYVTKKPTTTTYAPPNYPESFDMDPIENEIEPVRDIVRTVVDIEI